MRSVNQKFILIVVALLFSVSAKAQSPKEVPALSLKDINGRKFSLSDYKGKVVLLNFWATWCPPCRAEMPDLIRWQRAYGKRGLQVVGVTYPPTDLREVRSFIRRIRINYPVVLGTKETKALFDESETLPITVIIGPDQKTLETIEGILLPEEFEQKIKPLLKQSRRVTVHQSTRKLSRRPDSTIN